MVLASSVHTAQTVGFGLIATVMVLCAVNVVASKNVVRAALSLVLVMAGAGLGDMDRALLTRAREDVARWLGAADRVAPAELVDRILEDTAYAYELRGPRLAQARENVKKVRALIRRVQNRGYATFARIADYFRRLQAGEEANAVVAARGCVQLMTVHSAKGLEFPIVFLVRMHAGAGDRTPAISVVPKDLIVIGTTLVTLITLRFIVLHTRELRLAQRRKAP